MNTCKNLCDSYKNVGRKIPYSSGKVCFCSRCNKTFNRKDIVGYKCFCCKSLIRTTPKNKKNVVVRRI